MNEYVKINEFISKIKYANTTPLNIFYLINAKFYQYLQCPLKQASPCTCSVSKRSLHNCSRGNDFVTYFLLHLRHSFC